MRIRELTVRNYRPFVERLPFEFREQFSVIAGVNGRGKTAILDAIAVCLSRLLPQITRAKGGQRTLQPTDVHHGLDEAEFVMRLNCAGYPLDNFAVGYNREIQHLRATHLSTRLRNEIRNRYGPHPDRSDDAAPIAVYFTTDRAGFRRPKQLPSRVPMGQAAAYHGALTNRTVNYRDLMARLVATIQVENSDPRPNRANFGERTLQAMQTALATFLDGFANLRVEIRPLRLLVDKNRTPLELTQLSDGERSFLAMVCDLCRRLTLANPQMSNPLEGEGIVLIDELELHLHPTWQREVVEKLRATFPKLQFIVTTHSPFIVQTAREGEVIRLDGDLAVEPTGRSLEEVARLVMGVTNVERSPRYQEMIETAHHYLALAEEAKDAAPQRREEIRQQLVKMLAPFTDNPAYTALLERKGMIEPGN